MLRVIPIERLHLHIYVFISVFSFCLKSVISTKAQLKGVLKSKGTKGTVRLGKRNAGNVTEHPGLFTAPRRCCYTIAGGWGVSASNSRLRERWWSQWQTKKSLP